MIKVTDVTNFLGVTNTKELEPELPVKPGFDLEKEGERKILHKWTAPGRANKRNISPKSLRSLMIIFSVVALLLVIMQEFFLILAIASLIFISYILSATPPENINFEISNHGVDYNGQFYSWGDLKQFYFSKDGNTETLNVDVKSGLPGRLFLTIKDGDKEKLQEIFSRYLPFLEEAPRSVLDKAYDSVVGKFDLEK
ncbi:MAG: DUF5673 domain-containing protein [Patescibacteria group bacterium]|jgi:hypothetical protein